MRASLLEEGGVKNIISADCGAWETVEVNGERWVTGTEVGRRLGYYPSKPSTFNEKVIKRGLKEGKFQGLRVVETHRHRRCGCVVKEIPEYLIHPGDVMRIAMEVRTPTARKVRQRMVDSLEGLMGTAKPTIVVTAEPANDLVAATFERMLSERGEKVIRRLLGTIQQALIDLEGRLVGLEERGAAAAKMLNQTPGLYINDECRRYLNHLADIIVETAGRGTVAELWRAEQDEGYYPPGEPFSTVLRADFEAVQKRLLKKIPMAEAEATLERGAKRREEQAAARRARRAAKKKHERREQMPRDNVVRPDVWKH